MVKFVSSIGTTETIYSYHLMEIYKSIVCFEAVTGISQKATVDRLNLISRHLFQSNKRGIALQALFRFCKIPAYNSLSDKTLFNEHDVNLFRGGANINTI